MRSSDLGLGVICSSSRAIAGSYGNKLQFSLGGAGQRGKVQIGHLGASASVSCLTLNLLTA